MARPQHRIALAGAVSLCLWFAPGCLSQGEPTADQAAATEPSTNNPSPAGSGPEIVVQETDFQIRLQLNGMVVDTSEPTKRGYAVEVPLTPMQTLRLQSSSFTGTATLETTFGLRAVSCQSVNLVDPALGPGPSTDRVEESDGTTDPAPTDPASTASASTDPAGSEPAAPEASPEPSESESTTQGSSTRVARCALPPKLETAPGIGATVQLESTPLVGVRVVPNVAVVYDEASDRYYVETLDEAGQSEQVPIVPGQTDGVMRVLEQGPPAGTRLALPSSPLNPAPSSTTTGS